MGNSDVEVARSVIDGKTWDKIRIKKELLDQEGHEHTKMKRRMGSSDQVGSIDVEILKEEVIKRKT